MLDLKNFFFKRCKFIDFIITIFNKNILSIIWKLWKYNTISKIITKTNYLRFIYFIIVKKSRNPKIWLNMISLFKLKSCHLNC